MAGSERDHPPVLRAEVLRAESLTRSFGQVSALSTLSLQVAAGELYGLVGPDGAGKTTALRIFAGMIGYDSGSVTVLGQPPMSRAPELRAAVGYMPQQYSLYGDLTVDENLSFFARMFCLPRSLFAERRERLLELTRLARFGDRRAEQLSGGMYKKLALACALLPRPRLLLLDEPTNGVDPVSRRELWELLFELVDEGIAVVVSTPYMDEAARCQRVGLMQAGHVLLEGAPRALLEGFQHSVIELSGEGAVAAESWLESLEGVIAISVVGTRLRLVARADVSETVSRAVAARGFALRQTSPTFEDLFLAQTVPS